MIRKMELTPKEIASKDAGYWARLRRIRLPLGVFTFRNHEYQMEIMSSTARRRCYMKGRQGGYTQVEVVKTLHGMIHKYYPKAPYTLFPLLTM